MERRYCVGAFRALGQYWNPQRSGQGHKGQWEWRKRKRRVGASTYWKHGQPTASTTAFFWSWLSLDALLKFHKYSNAKLDKKMYLWLNSKVYLHFSCSFKEVLDTQQQSLCYYLKLTQTHFHPLERYHGTPSPTCPHTIIVIIIVLRLDEGLSISRLLCYAQHLLLAPLKLLLPHLNALHPD